MGEVLQGREILVLGILVEQIGCYDNLIKEIPTTVVEECALALLGQNVVPGVVHVSFAHLVNLGLGLQHLVHTLVGRVIVHVAHHEHLHVLVESQKTVLHRLGLACTRLAIERSGEAAGPVAHDDSHILTCQLATHGKEATGEEGTVLCLLLHIGHQFHIRNGEKSRIVEQRTVNAATVGTLYVAVLHAAALQRFLLDEGIQHFVVLHLSHADESTPHLRQLIGTHVGKHFGHVAQLVGVLHSVPPFGRKILIVVLAFVVTGIEEVLLIIEAYGIGCKFLLGCNCQVDKQQDCQK